MNTILLSAAIALIIGLVITPILIPFLRKLKFGQSIREEGPKWHQKKSGTPTMGGISIMLSVVASAIVIMKVVVGSISYDILILVISSLLFGVVGFIDDFIKVVMKRNLGLSAKAKFLLQLLVSIFTAFLLLYTGTINSEIIIPFYAKLVNIGIMIMPFLVLVELSVVNSVNLTDGVDGLATGVTLVVSVFLCIVSFLMEEISVAIFMAAVSGSLIAFLFFNWNPAKVFMGDTGSLYLGGCIAVAATILKMPVILIIIGGVYLMETLSVIIQVVSFKTRKKRVFKMTPIHHHFEMCGFNEKKIVFVFSGVTALLCVIGFLSILSFIGW